MQRISVLLIPLIVALVSGALTLLMYPFVHFGRPEALWLLGVLIATASLWSYKNHRRKKKMAAIFHPKAAESLLQTWSPRRANMRFLLFCAAAYCLVLAAAQPQWGEQTRRVQREGIDIVVVLDASRSMLAEDVAPDRLRAATAEIDRLLMSLEGDRVGLVIFAGLAFTQSPLTTDYGATRLYLSRINPEAMPSQGTALGRAILEAHRLLVGRDNPDFRRAPHQLIIVVSDGEDHETDPVQAAAAAFEDGIRTFTVGVGTATGGRIPLRDNRGHFAGYLNDRNDNIVHSRLEDAQLQEIAAAGGGAYQRHTASGSSASFLAAEIDKFDQASLSSVLRAHYVDRGHFFLWPALLLLFIALMLDERPVNQRLGRWFHVLLVLLILPLSGCLDFKQRDPNVARAINLADEGRYTDALEELDRANTDAKRQHAFRFNRARLLEELQRFEDAQEDYLYALGAPFQPLRIASFVGLGNTLFHLGDYDAAIERYRRALTIDPHHQAARRNLEIAHRHRFPVCSELEDNLEANDGPDQASNLPEQSFKGPWAHLYAQPSEDPLVEEEALVLCGGNEDWFLIPAALGERADIKVTFQRLREDDGGPPLPSHINPTDVRIALLDGHGNFIAVDQGLQDGQELRPVPANKVERKIQGVDLPVANAPYYLQLEAMPAVEFTYEIEVTLTPPCSALPDPFDPNSEPTQAYAVDSGNHTARICIDHDDWFKMRLATDEHLFVDIQGKPTEEFPSPALRTALHTEDDAAAIRPNFSEPNAGRSVLQQGPATQGETVRWAVSSDGNFEGEYSIDVYHFEACPAGNDRFEPNDRPSEATELDASSAELRHLRLCPSDQDWFVMNLPQDDEEEDPKSPLEDQGPKYFSAWAEFTEEDRQVTVELWDPKTGMRLATDVPIVETSYADEEGKRQGVIAITELPEDATAIVIRVLGDQGFYHLSFPDIDPPPSESSSQSDTSDSDENEDQNGEQNNEDSQDEDDTAQDSESGDEHEPDNPDDSNAADEMQPEEEEAQRRALMQLLESLEDDSINLQMMQALEREPPPRMRNEW